MFADSVDERDGKGRTLLHIACSVPCEDSFEIVETLLKLIPEAAYIADGNGRTPLMLACAHGKEMDPRVIKALVKASQEAVVVEDEEGMSALEYALLSEVSGTLFRKLQVAHAKQMKKESAKAA